MQIRAEVIENFEVARGQFLLVLEASQISQEVKPGQFVMVRLDGFTDPLLPRPFTVSFASSSEIEIIYRVVGKATSLMSNLKSGDKVVLEGPYGKGFEIIPQRCLLLAGGVGLASLRFLSWKIHEKGGEQFLLYGEREERDLLPIHNLFPSEIEKRITLEERGQLVTDFLSEAISEFIPDIVYACGSREMLKLVALKVSGKLQVAMEEVMACGKGHCYGCVVKKRESYVRVCQEGPIFWKEEVDWT